MTVTVDSCNDSAATWLPDAAAAQSLATAALAQAEYTSAPCSISLRYVDSAESRLLNSNYRGKDKPTNVLSFPAALPDSVVAQLDSQPLGDIVICPEILTREATEQNKDRLKHWAHLLVHGVLHLIGYDHQQDDDAAIMERLETVILANQGIADPYRAL